MQQLIVKVHAERLAGKQRMPGDVISAEEIDGRDADEENGIAALPGISPQVLAALISQGKVAWEDPDAAGGGAGVGSLEHLHARLDKSHAKQDEHAAALDAQAAKIEALHKIVAEQAAENESLHDKLDAILVAVKKK